MQSTLHLYTPASQLNGLSQLKLLDPEIVQLQSAVVATSACSVPCTRARPAPAAVPITAIIRTRFLNAWSITTSSVSWWTQYSNSQLRLVGKARASTICPGSAVRRGPQRRGSGQDWYVRETVDVVSGDSMSEHVRDMSAGHQGGELERIVREGDAASRACIVERGWSRWRARGRRM